jgi:hypothetical protein
MIDRLIFNFGRDFPALIEFGSRAVAAIVNDRNHAAFAGVLSSLDKAFQKRMRPRFAFLCSEVLECVPLTRETADVGIRLLDGFSQQHSLKGNFRNSVNDMMILAAAISSKDDLLTEDSLLARFAASVRGAPFTEERGGTLRINFGRGLATRSTQTRESKGYINRGWRVAEDVRRNTA